MPRTFVPATIKRATQRVIAKGHVHARLPARAVTKFPKLTTPGGTRKVFGRCGTIRVLKISAAKRAVTAELSFLAESQVVRYTIARSVLLSLLLRLIDCCTPERRRRRETKTGRRDVGARE